MSNGLSMMGQKNVEVQEHESPSWLILPFPVTLCRGRNKEISVKIKIVDKVIIIGSPP